MKRLPKLIKNDGFVIISTFLLLVLSLTIIRPNTVDLLITQVLSQPDSLKFIERNSFAENDKLSNYMLDNNQTVKGIKIEKINGYNFDVVSTDLRVKVLEEYFNSINSPLSKHANVFIQKADKYKFAKWSLLPAIAKVETGGCVTENFRGYGIHNCWGWRRNGRDIIFSSWDDAVDNLIRNLKGWSTDPYVMQRSYCPPCEASGSNKWANGVASEMKKMNNIAKKFQIEGVNIKGK